MIKWVLWVAAAALLAAGCYGPGTYGVAPTPQNGKIGVGLWHTQGSTNLGAGPCRWTRTVGGQQYGGVSFGGPRYVEIKQGDDGFTTSGCEPWVQAKGPFDKQTGPALQHQPCGGCGKYVRDRNLAQGTYIVGTEAWDMSVFKQWDHTTWKPVLTGDITWGLYQLAPGCHWQRLRGFGGEPGDVIAEGFGGDGVSVFGNSVRVYETDYGFNVNCRAFRY